MKRIVWNSERSSNKELLNILPIDVRNDYFAKRLENFKILDSLLGKEVDKLDDHGCPNVQDLFDEAMWICSNYPFRHKTTLHYAGCKAKLFGKWIKQHIKSYNFCIVQCFVSIYDFKSFKAVACFFAASFFSN